MTEPTDLDRPTVSMTSTYHRRPVDSLAGLDRPSSSSRVTPSASTPDGGSLWDLLLIALVLMLLAPIVARVVASILDAFDGLR